MINIKTEKIKNQNKMQSLKTKFNDFSIINKNIFNNKKIVIGISPQKYLMIFIVIPRNLVTDYIHIQHNDRWLENNRSSHL